MNKNYSFFGKSVFRTPAYSFVDRESVGGGLGSEFREALYLASFDFYNEKIRELKGERDGNDEKFEQSIYKYARRSCTRCTPFGLFAGCSVAEVADKSDIVLERGSQCRRVTRLDMNYVSALVQSVEQQKQFRKQLRYSPNDTVYRFGNSCRYIEYFYSGVKMVHKISGVEFDEYIDKILRFVAGGKLHNDIVEYLVDDEITREEAYEFVEELIDSQILKSELELSVTGDSVLDVLIERLLRLNGGENIVRSLIEVRKMLDRINSSPVGTTIGIYDEISAELDRLGVKYDPKYLFQTDMFKPSIKAEISQGVIDEIYSCLTFLNKLQSTPQKGSIEQFVKSFTDRYDDRQMPLLEVMDSELGIGAIYLGDNDDNDLLRGVMVRNRQPNPELTVSNLAPFILKKYVECVKNKSNTLTLLDSDLRSGIEADWSSCAATMAVMCSIIKSVNGDNLIYLKSAGGSCAANLLGRFCHIDSQIESMVRSVVDIERVHYRDAIVAEIVHLPESRIGNILFRPTIREYEIHYMAQSSVGNEFRIPVSDLYVSVKGGRVVLFSKRLNKEIIPRLTTAHNFSHNSLPVYRFLCELQHQNLRGGFGFGWDRVFDSLDYKPRVVYGNTILSREQWRIAEEDFDKIDYSKSDELAQMLLDTCAKRAIPRCVMISEGDNELFIDFDDTTAVEVFLSYLKRRKVLWLNESLFDENSAVVKDVDGKPYCNEFMFLFHKTVSKL